MKIQLLRHATTLLQFGGQCFILDPMLSPAGAMDPVPGVPCTDRNPLVDLPVDAAAALNGLDAVIVSHLHRDHFDEAAMGLLPNGTPLFCQPGDQESIMAAGFTSVQEIERKLEWQGIIINRTGGRHGSGRIGEKMGPVSGFVLEAPGEPTIYITGDTIWCGEVAEALRAYEPQAIVCYAGEACFASGGPITMNKEDILELCRSAPGARVVVVHMEAWNHCRLSRQDLCDFLAEQGLSSRVSVPADGEILEI